MLTLVVAVSAVSVWAQSEMASLTGVVRDTSGGAMPGVVVVITHEATQTAVELVTNERGAYVAPSLRPATYTITVTADGFKAYVQSGITLQVNQRARIDIALEVGQTTEEISVVSAPPLLQTETSSRGAVVDERTIVELPLNGRDYNQLALLSPGVLAATPRLQSIGFKGVFNVNGNRAFQNAFRLDGVDNTSYSNSFRGGNAQVIQPSIEALQEFKIQTNAYSAEFGRSAGALVNAVIKSGSNEFHGSAYEFHRNDDLDATNFFANRAGQEKPSRLRNQFGTTFGGPIVANRTFFFGDYEGLRDREGTVRFSSVPQPAWREGRFSIPIANPFNPADTGQDFRQPATPDCNDGNGNCWIIPAELVDPVGKAIVDVSPDPNTGATGQIDNNFVSSPVRTNRTHQFDVRIDHVIASPVTVFGRYSFADTEIFQPAPRPGLSEGSFNDTFGTADWRSQALAFGGTWTMSPTLVSEFRVGYNDGDFFQLPPNFGSGCPGDLIGLQGAPTDPAICGGIPVIDFPGGNLRRIGRTTSVPQFQTPRSYNISGSVTQLRGAHTLKLGGELLHVETGIQDVSSLLGRFTFRGRFANQNGEWQGALADLLMGLPTRYRQDSNTVFQQWQKIYGVYAQDDWRATPRLTVNLGLRWEFATPPRERDFQIANFNPDTRTFDLASPGSLYSESLIHPDSNNVAPRIGFAYTLHPRTVLRAAYGIFYNHTNRQGREGLLGFNLPFIILSDANISGSGRLTADEALFQLDEGIPADLTDPARINPATTSRKAQDPNQVSPYTQQWNVGVQHQLGADLVLDLAYVGNMGRKLPAFRNLNQRALTFDPATGAPLAGARPLAEAGLDGDIQFLENIGTSNYHALQARLERRFSRGLSALVSYTWGKALTDAVDHLATSGVGNGIDVGVDRTPQNPLNRAAEYGPAGFDRTHRFVASAVWEIPYGRGRPYGANVSGLVDTLLGGWEVASIVTASSGLALTIRQDQLLNLGGERSNRPMRICDGTLPASQRTVERFFDADCFQVLRPDPTAEGFIPNQAFGDSGVGVIRGPGLVNVDLKLGKRVALAAGHELQFRAEVFNLFNRPNFGVPGVRIGAGFGQIVNTATEARIIQLAVKYRF